MAILRILSDWRSFTPSHEKLVCDVCFVAVPTHARDVVRTVSDPIIGAASDLDLRCDPCFQAEVTRG